MSNPAPQNPTAAGGEPADRRKSIGKYVKRLSSVLRRGSSKSSVPKVATASTASTPAPAETTAPIIEPAEPLPEQSPAAPTPEEPVAITTSAGPSAVPGAYVRSAIQQERARALFAKYGLTLEAHEWITSGPTANDVQRVEKPIRMRVHRVCHRCSNTFGTDRVCTKCEHRRCKKCPRYPAKKPKDPQAPVEAKGKEAEPPHDHDDGDALAAKEKKKRKHQLTMKTKAGGEVVYSPPRQRIRRMCHKCETLFNPPTSTVCENCDHVRCTKCPREPPKPKKWPDGYPGDMPYEASDDEPAKPEKPERAWRKPRQRVRWSCHLCSGTFTEGIKLCEKCHHERCEQCTRVPLKKDKQEFDPELVKRVEEKIAALAMQSPPAET